MNLYIVNSIFSCRKQTRKKKFKVKDVAYNYRYYKKFKFKLGVVSIKIRIYDKYDRVSTLFDQKINLSFVYRNLNTRSIGFNIIKRMKIFESRDIDYFLAYK